jgi:hypothetical protein
MSVDNELKSCLTPESVRSMTPLVLDSIGKDRLPRHKAGEAFLRGPVPLAWIRKGAQLRGKALAVGLALWFKAGMTGDKEITAGKALWERVGIGRKSAYRGLNALERAGLVLVVRHRGRCPRVTIRPP